MSPTADSPLDSTDDSTDVPPDDSTLPLGSQDAARFARVLKGLSLREFLRRNPPAELPDSLDAESFGFGPFSCDLDETRMTRVPFVFKNTRKEHMYTHLGEVPYVDT